MNSATGSSWINQVEPWLAFLTDQMLRRGLHKSVQALEAGIRAWVDAWNQDPRSFIWAEPTVASNDRTSWERERWTSSASELSVHS